MGSTTLPEVVPSACRLRSVQTRLDSVTNAAFFMETAVSANQCRAAAAAGVVQQEASGRLGEFMSMSLLGEHSLDGSSMPDQSQAGPKMSRAHLQGAMQQVDKLQSDIAGMEAVVAAVRGVPLNSALLGNSFCVFCSIQTCQV